MGVLTRRERERERERERGESESGESNIKLIHIFKIIYYVI